MEIPASIHAIHSKSQPASPRDGIPAGMCFNCGAGEKHESPTECIEYWRDRTARLEFRLASFHGRQRRANGSSISP